VIFYCVKKPWFTADWIGKTLNADTLEQLKKLNQKTGLDICGENGEYHTLVLDGPPFKKRIQMGSHSTIQQDSLMYIDIHGLKLCDKP
jgi:diphthamide synthase (EF-2-diphthine--ammonia ligase)